MLELSGVVTRNLHGQAVSLIGDTELCGPCRFAKVKTNGFNLTVSTPAHHGITIDGTKNPELWGENVIFTVPIYPLNATHVEVVTAPDAFALEFRGQVAGWNGQDGLDAWDYWVTEIHANPGMTYEEVRALFLVWREGGRNYIDFDFAVDGLQRTFQLEGWDALKGLILSKSPTAWRGEPVPTGEVIS